MFQHRERTSTVTKNSSDQTLAAARVLVASLAIGPLLFGGVVVFLHAMNGSMLGPGALVGKLLACASVVLVVAGVILGIVAGRRAEKSAADSDNPASHQDAMTVVVLRAAWIEAPALLAAVAALLTSQAYLLITLVCCGLLAVQWMRLPNDLRRFSGTVDDFGFDHRRER